MEPPKPSLPSGPGAARGWCARAGALVGFSLAATVAAVLGARLGWMSIPPEVRDPPGPVPPGTRLVVPEGRSIPASASPAALRDHLFAEENGLRLTQLFERGTLRELPPGTGLVVRRCDLNLLQVEIGGAGGQTVWIPLAPFAPAGRVASPSSGRKAPSAEP